MWSQPLTWRPTPAADSRPLSAGLSSSRSKRHPAFSVSLLISDASVTAQRKRPEMSPAIRRARHYALVVFAALATRFSILLRGSASGFAARLRTSRRLSARGLSTRVVFVALPTNFGLLFRGSRSGHVKKLSAARAAFSFLGILRHIFPLHDLAEIDVSADLFQSLTLIIVPEPTVVPRKILVGSAEICQPITFQPLAAGVIGTVGQ